jgi:hypothetical protein
VECEQLVLADLAERRARVVVAEPVLEAARSGALRRYDLMVGCDLKLREVERRKQDYRRVGAAACRRNRSTCLAQKDDQRCEDSEHQCLVTAHPHLPSHLP